MTKRENIIALLKRQPFEEYPIEFNLCPSLNEEYKKQMKTDKPYWDYFGFPWRNVGDIRMEENTKQFEKYFKNGLKDGSAIDIWGVGHEPGSSAAMHMTHMVCPLSGIDDIEEIKKYPFPKYQNGDATHQKAEVKKIKDAGVAATGNMQCTIWETAWYMRGMEDLMMDMMTDDPIADYILDTVTEQSIIRASSFAKAGVDFLYLGDDIGMQNSIMMSEELYCKWIKPRLKRVIDSAKAINPDIVVFYHSCGYVTPFIPHLIDVGVDVLNPLQTECMDFKEVYDQYGDKICFHGAMGTQTIMPFGTPQEVKEMVFSYYAYAKHGGLIVAPTHLLEPEVPFENVLAYVEACHELTARN